MLLGITEMVFSLNDVLGRRCERQLRMRWSLKFHDKSAHIRIEGVSLGQFISLHLIPLHFIPLRFTSLISLTYFHPPGKLCCFQILTYSHRNAEFWRHDYGT